MAKIVKDFNDKTHTVSRRVRTKKQALALAKKFEKDTGCNFQIVDLSKNPIAGALGVTVRYLLVKDKHCK